MIQYPNKTFVLDTVVDNLFGNSMKFVVVVAGKDKETACQHLRDTIGFKGIPNELVWLPDTNHPTLYDQRGDKPLDIQAKILYNASVLLK